MKTGLVVHALEDRARAEAEVRAFGIAVLIGVRDVDVTLGYALDHAVVAEKTQQCTTIRIVQFVVVQFAEIHN
jgi:hypothetical protein